MGKFILYTILGTAATFAILLHLSLLPHLMKLPDFANGPTADAILGEMPAFLMTLAISWIIWWSISGMLLTVFYSIGNYSTLILFSFSLAVVFGVTLLIT
jgi:hypothetical protein